MTILEKVELPLKAEEDVVAIRQAARAFALRVQLSLLEQTKIVTAASELARNTLVHGGGGKAAFEIVEQGMKRGLRITFEDQGPGIADLTRAMQDGYSSAGGLGLGLGGSKRLCSEFSIDSRTGVGTRVAIATWKR